MKKKHPPVADLHAIPCCACAGPHRLEDCATEAAVKLLEADGKVMTAVKVRARIGGGR